MKVGEVYGTAAQGVSTESVLISLLTEKIK